MKPLLLEIGCEELPPAAAPAAATELATRVVRLLDAEKIPHGRAQLFYTPRRLAVRVNDVSPERPSREIEVLGPPKQVAFDASGHPTKAAIGFARIYGRSPADLGIRETGKGEYVFLRTTVPAVSTAKVLKESLSGQLHLQFAKSMRWQEDGTRFARPVRWLLCLLGEEIIPLEFAGLVAGNLTFGHRNWSSEPSPVRTPDEYETVLGELRVIVSPDVRRNTLIEGLAAAALKAGGKPYPDPELVEETVNIVEWPVPILGRFDNNYLKLPRAVLVTALRRHQHCFAVVSAENQLTPFFIAVANTPGCDHQQVRMWHEKAVDSRLRDAQFFVETDLSIGLEPLVNEEKKVIWLEGMGTLFDKTQRLRELCRHLARLVPAANAQILDRAALLCKADLLSQVVREKEFTSLQGEMGGFYARMLGEVEGVATAIALHYWPAYFAASEDLHLTAATLSPEARLLAIADKLDNIVGSFLTGILPTGSEDPLGLRRQALELLTLIQSGNLSLNIEALASFASTLFPAADKSAFTHILDFFRERLSTFLADANIRYDIADAVLAVHWQTPTAALACAEALTQFRMRPEFERLIIGQKRVANILKGMQPAGSPEERLFRESAETALWLQARQIQPEVDRLVAAHSYSATFDLLLGLRPAIDRFFDDVLVMTDDPVIRENRLRLLQYIRSLFLKVADLSQIVIEVASAESPSSKR